MIQFDEEKALAHARIMGHALDFVKGAEWQFDENIEALKAMEEQLQLLKASVTALQIELEAHIKPEADDEEEEIHDSEKELTFDDDE